MATVAAVLELAVAKWARPDNAEWVLWALGVSALALLLLFNTWTGFYFLGGWLGDVADYASRVTCAVLWLVCLVGFINLHDRFGERRSEERRKGLRPYPEPTRADRALWAFEERLVEWMRARDRLERHPVMRVISLVMGVFGFAVLAFFILRPHL